MDQSLTYRQATLADVPTLAAMNHRLIEDEGHRNPMNERELAERLRSWLGGRHVATLFDLDGRSVAYALWKDEPDWVYLRHFFVERDVRRRGIGRGAIRSLLGEVWPPGKRVRVEVLTGNAAGMAFWRAVGFRDYVLTLELQQEP